jgi:hypothetical protein
LFSKALLLYRHYEMLKLHHMNLLNEIQETTLMMNLYQQQQLQQQQQQLQQQANVDALSNTDSQMSALLQQKSQEGGGLNAFDVLGNNPLTQHRRSSLGLDSQLNFSPHQMLMQQQQMMSNNAGLSGTAAFASAETAGNSADTKPNASQKKTKESEASVPGNAKADKKRSPKSGGVKNKRQKSDINTPTNKSGPDAQV